MVSGGWWSNAFRATTVVMIALVLAVPMAPGASEPAGQEQHSDASSADALQGAGAIQDAMQPLIESGGSAVFLPGPSSWIAHTLGGSWHITSKSIAMPDGTRIQFDGHAAVPGVGVGTVPIHDYFGADPASWSAREGHLAVRFSAVLPGVDLLVRGSGHDIEFDHVLAPGADPASIRVSANRDIALRADGGLGIGELHVGAPVAFQGNDAVAAAWALTGQVATYQLGEYDATRALVIDPLLRYSSFHGNYQREYGYDIAVMPVPGSPDKRWVVFGGGTDGSHLSGSGGALAPAPGFTSSTSMIGPGRSYDGFVARMTYDLATHAIVADWWAFIGGSSTEYVNGLDVDASGNVYLGGNTGSSNFPVLNPIVVSSIGDPPYDGSSKQSSGQPDGWVAKLDASGNLLFASYLGSDSNDEVNDVKAGPGGDLIAVGEMRVIYSTAPDFPTKNALQSTPGTPAGLGSDGFVSRVTIGSPTSDFVFSTFLGSALGDLATAVDVDSVQIAVTGYTAFSKSDSTTFPLTPGAYMDKPAMTDQTAPFVTSYKLDGSDYRYSTLVDGDGNEWPHDLILDSSGDAWITGFGYSFGLPICGAPCPAPFQATYGGGLSDGFVYQVKSDGTDLLYASYAGGSETEYLYGIGYDAASDDVAITGYTKSNDYPLTADAIGAAWLPTTTFDYMPVVTRIKSSGDLRYSSFHGGDENGNGRAVALDEHWNVYLTGYTEPGAATSFPLVNAVQTTPGGIHDIYVAIQAKTPPKAVVRSTAGSLTESSLTGATLVVPGGTAVSFDSLLSVDGDFPIDHAFDEWTLTHPSLGTVATGTGGPTAGFSPFTASSPGTYTVCVKVWDTDPIGAYDRTSTACMDVQWTNVAPVALCGVPAVAKVGDTVTMTDLSTDDDGTIAAWSWDFGDGSTSTVASPTHAYAAMGTYTVTLTVTDDYGATDSWTCTIDIEDGPIAAFDAPTSAVAAGSSVYLTDASIAGSRPIATWHWDFGDGNSVTLVGPGSATHAYAATGTYVVRLTVDDGTYSDTTTRTVSVETSVPMPTADVYTTKEAVPIDAAAPGLLGNDGHSAGLAMTVVSATTPAHGTLSWQADGSFVYTPEVGFLGIDGFQYTLTDGENTAGPIDVTLQVVARLAPDARFNPIVDRFVVRTHEYSLPGDHDILTWAWDFGDGTTSTERAPSHEFEHGGHKYITLVVTDSWGLKDSVTHSVYIQPRHGQPEPGHDAPPVNAGPNRVIRGGDTVVLDGSGSDVGNEVHYQWTQISGPTVSLVGSNTAFPVFLAPAATSAEQVLVFELVTYDGITWSAADQVSIVIPPANRGPDAVIAAASDAVEGTELRLDGSGSSDPDGDPLRYRWIQTRGPSALLAQEGAQATAQLPLVSEATELTFRLMVTDGALADAAEVTVRVLPAAPSGIEFDAVFVDDYTVQFVTEDVRLKTWGFGDGSTVSHAAAPVHRFPGPGTYTVSLLVGEGNEMERATKVITVEAPSVVPAPQDESATSHGEEPVVQHSARVPMFAWAGAALVLLVGLLAFALLRKR